MSASKNDNITRCWRGDDHSIAIPHWCIIGNAFWRYYVNARLLPGDVFCLNDADHEPPPPGLHQTRSLRGLV